MPRRIKTKPFEERTSFPNMTSMIQYELWRNGIDKTYCAAYAGITTTKALAASRLLVNQGLATAEKEGDLLVLRPVLGKRLDRTIFTEPPPDVDAWV